jgi:hypothetical protein
MTSSDALLNPDMPSEQIKLHMGEMSAQDIRNVRAAIRWANEKAAARIRELEAVVRLLHHGVSLGTHVIVPVWPTRAMISAGEDALDDFYDSYDGFYLASSDTLASAAYRAMIKIAQEQDND